MSRLARLLMVLVLAMPRTVGCSVADSTPPPVASGPTVDDFLGPAGAAPNPNLWVHDVGPSAERGWERGSVQTYTDASDNVRLDGQGHLIIQARKSGDGYTSGRLVTRGKVDFGYGTIAARIKFPSGQGIWPAFWMLGSNIDVVGWPKCGEIDLMEIVNSGSTYHVRLHGPDTENSVKDTEVGTSGPIADLTDDFHVFWMTRQEDSITVGVDGTTLEAFTPASLPTAAPWVYNGPMHVLLNVAVGGDWPGPPDDSTHFPATMLVDWVRFEPITA